MKRLILTTVVFLSGVANMAQASSSSVVMSGTQVVSEGAFASIGTHAVEGAARVEQRADGAYLVLSEDFNTVAGPDLRVVLRDSTGAMTMVVVAPLNGFQGIQEFALPLNEAGLQGFDEVVIYCAKFHVDFGIAKLQ
jgi:hypothetical protein